MIISTVSQILKGDYVLLENGNALLEGTTPDGTPWRQEIGKERLEEILSSDRTVKTFWWDVPGWLNRQYFTGTQMEYEEYRDSINY
jgi:hypothetical protein